MLSKQTAAAAPLAVFLYDWIFLSGSFLDTLRRRWPVYLALAATWLLLIPSFAPQANAQHASAGFQVGGITWLSYAVTQLGVILHYLRLSFWPAGLCLDYNWPLAKGAAAIWPGAVVVGGLAAATAAALALRPATHPAGKPATHPAGKPAWGFLGAWFFLSPGAVLQLHADRRPGGRTSDVPGAGGGGGLCGDRRRIFCSAGSAEAGGARREVRRRRWP